MISYRNELAEMNKKGNITIIHTLDGNVPLDWQGETNWPVSISLRTKSESVTVVELDQKNAESGNDGGKDNNGES